MGIKPERRKRTLVFNRIIILFFIWYEKTIFLVHLTLKSNLKIYKKMHSLDACKYETYACCTQKQQIRNHVVIGISSIFVAKLEL